VPGKPDQSVLGLIKNADLVIYDSTYTDEEFPKYVTWGHSTWQEGVRLANAANVKRLVIFHHDPSHDDTIMDSIAAAAEKARPGTVVAVEGLTLEP
jgi:phosphoribosyl 1,2-cyclic phosphodiesterase